MSTHKHLFGLLRLLLDSCGLCRIGLEADVSVAAANPEFAVVDINGDGKVDAVEGLTVERMPYLRVVAILQMAMSKRPLTLIFRNESGSIGDNWQNEHASAARTSSLSCWEETDRWAALKIQARVRGLLQRRRVVEELEGMDAEMEAEIAKLAGIRCVWN